jgi:hypothetical protein
VRKLAAPRSPSPGRPVRVVGGDAGRVAPASAPATTPPLLKQKLCPSIFPQRGKLKLRGCVTAIGLLIGRTCLIMLPILTGCWSYDKVDCLAKPYQFERLSVDPAEGRGWRVLERGVLCRHGERLRPSSEPGEAHVRRPGGSLDRVCATKTVGQPRGFPSVRP